MKLTTLKHAALALAALLTFATKANAQEPPYAFNVLNQRSVALTSRTGTRSSSTSARRAACRSS